MNFLTLIEKNWDRWSTQMRVLFKFQDISDVVEGGCQVPTDSTDAHKTSIRKRDNKALFIIH